MKLLRKSVVSPFSVQETNANSGNVPDSETLKKKSAETVT